MNCADCKELLVEYTENLLEASVKINVSDHLEQCPACREESEAVRTLQKRLIDDNREAGKAPLKDAVMNKILGEQNSWLKTADTESFSFRILRFILKNPMVRIVAAAAVIVAIIIGLNSIQDNVTFAKAVAPVLNARTLEYDIIAPSDNGFVFHDVVVGQRVRRTIPFMKMEMIIDEDNLQVLALDPEHRSATVWNTDQSFADLHRDYMKLIRSAVTRAINGPQSDVEELGQENIEGVAVLGFKIHPEKDASDLTIWIDPATALPVQIDIHTENSARRLIGSDFSLRNIVFNIPVDESLVRLEPPSGYIMEDQQLFASRLYEDDFLEMLQVWTKYSPLQTFPVTLDSLMNPLQLVLNLRALGAPKDSFDAFTSAFMRGLMFIAVLDHSEADNRYSGNGVRFGQGDVEVFRYRVPDSDSWRVIYGDLHVEDVTDGGSSH